MLMRGRRRRCAGRPGGKARGGSGAPEAGEDSMEEEEPRRPGQDGEEAGRVPWADGGVPVAWRGGGEGVGGAVDAGFREAGGGESRGGRGRGAPQKAAVGEDDGGGGGGRHDDDDDGGSGTKKWLSAGGDGC
jgi:hypothetical protein